MKGPIFITNYERKEERPRCKAFKQTQAFPPIEQALILQPRSEGELTEQPLTCSVSTRCIGRDEKKTANPYYGA